jgi:uncharacterized membrane protein
MGKTIGLILILIGVALWVWTGFNYTKKEKIVDAGTIELSVDKQKTVSWPPYLGGIVLIAGIVVWIGSRNSHKMR